MRQIKKLKPRSRKWEFDPPPFSNEGEKKTNTYNSATIFSIDVKRMVSANSNLKLESRTEVLFSLYPKFIKGVTIGKFKREIISHLRS